MNNNINNNNNISRTNGAQACAACKYQRRKCAPDCILAPYFPHDRQRQFLNAHKLFGVSNITKIIKNLDQPDKDEAMRTIIFQSDARARDPVGGCYRIIHDLQTQIHLFTNELQIVTQQVESFRAQAEAQAHAFAQIHHRQQQQHILANDGDDATLNCEVIDGDVDPLRNSYDMIVKDYNSPALIDFHLQFQQPNQEGEEQFNIMQNDHDHVSLQEVNSWGLQDSISSSIPVLQQNSVNECDDHHHIKPLLDLPIDRQEFRFESGEIIDHQSFQFPDEDDDTIKGSNKGISPEENVTFHEHAQNDSST